MENLRVALLQSFLYWEDKVANLQQFTEKLAPLAGNTDLVILPEMFTTGFSMNAAKLAESMDDRTMQWLATQAKKLHILLFLFGVFGNKK